MINGKIREYALLALILLVIFGVYLRTTFPAFKGNDSPETAAAAYTLGIQHAPGYPFYTMLGKIAVSAYLANPALKVNLLSALLAVLTLMITYFIITRHIFRLAGIETGGFSCALGLGLIGLLAFSNVFWSQAIEAKGGIYMLNLLFLAALLLLAFILLEGFSEKHMLLLIYIFGLSLANHWPSMLILAPVFAYIIYRHRKEFNRRVAVRGLLVFCAAVSAYLFLYIRAGAKPELLWGNPASISGLIDVIMRKMYSGSGASMTTGLIAERAGYIFKALGSNYAFIWLMAFPGFYVLHKKQRAVSWVLVSALVITAASLVFYGRTGLEQVWLLGIFMMPAQYALFIMLAAGAAYAAGFAKPGIARISAAALPVALCFFMLYLNMEKNNRSRDYISYDLIRNITASFGRKAYYLTEHDMYLMPMLYEKLVQKKQPGLKLFPLPFLIHEWGVGLARQVFGYFPAKNGDVLYNLAGITGIAAQDAGVIYRDFTSPAFDALRLPLYTGYCGMVKRVSTSIPADSPRIYELYSFRGIYSGFAQSDENLEIVTRYLIFMSLHAERLLYLKRYTESAALYRKALAIPAEKLERNIYLKLAEAYRGIGDDLKMAEFAEKAAGAEK